MNIKLNSPKKNTMIVALCGAIVVIAFAVFANKQHTEISELKQQNEKLQTALQTAEVKLSDAEGKQKTCDLQAGTLEDQSKHIHKLEEAITAFSIQAESCEILKKKLNKKG